MPTINENIAELQQKTTNLISAHNDIKNAIISKGGVVSSGDKFSDFPDDIGTIRKDLTSININENGVYKNGTLDTVTGNTYPIEIVANGSPIVSITMDGDTVQNETPTPTAPVDVNGVGVLETIGEHSGQYKIPISCGGVTTDVYLGEVETTRKIGKIDLGTLDWGKTTSGNFWANNAIENIRIISNGSKNNAFCNMFKEVTAEEVTSTPYSFSSCLNGTGRPFINSTGFENMSAAEFKEAISGVYMWYVLVTPETDTINEPLMKIGDYADQLTLTDSDITIPTVTGNNVVDYDLTVKPSSTSLSYYKLGINKTIVSDTLPIEFESNGNPLESYSIMGNTVQNGTPTPSNPIQPQSCGERTGNLLDKTRFTDVGATIEQIEDGIRIITQSGGYAARIVLDVLQNTDYTVSYIYKKISGSGANVVKVFAGTGSSTEITSFVSKTNGTFNTGNNTKINIWFYASFGMAATVEYTKIMLNTGSTALPYEPYGIKIPILSNNTTTPVYLGEVETTRKVKKLVLTGEELFTIKASGNNTYFAHSLIKPAIRTQAEICTHLTYATITASNTDVGFSIIENGTELRIRIPNAASTSLADFETFLAAQYANGTPVTVWYVLATPTTGIVNEPLMKIDDYADSIVDTQTQIPTVYGDNTFDVGTTIKPSSVSITYDDINTIGYNEINVDVPNTYTVEDEGKVVNNATLVAQTAMPTEITANDTYDTTLYNSIVVNVPTGGSAGTKNDVTFYDYDGTIIQSYSAADFANLSELPANPTHEGLTAQGWNWNLSDAKTYVNKHGKLDIGQMYITDDGKTRLYITLTEGRISPILNLYLNANSELDIDWGDGSTHSTFTTTTAGYVSGRHNYSSPGDYVIAITVTTGSFELRSSSSIISSILWNGNNNGSSPDRAYNSAIKKVEIGTGITNIGQQAFQHCYSLTSVTIPDTITGISQNAFYSCYSLQSITIPDTATSIAASAFQNCYSLTSVTIGSGVTSIGNNAFQYCYSLQSITIPDTVTSIGNGVFYQCYSLTSITIPDSVTSISVNAFYGCYALSSITIPDTVTSIGNNAFYQCYSLTSITIGNSVTIIGTSAFQNCSALSSIVLGSGVTSIGAQAFMYCYALTSIVIPDSVTSIGASAFSGCSALSSVTIPDTITGISQNAFYSCYSLQSITIPDTATSIAASAFQNCTYMESIKFKSTTPPTVSNSNAWSGVPTSCIILVPINTFAAYTTATNYPNPSTFTYLVYGTYASGDTLPSTSTDNYIFTWYATTEDAIAQTNPITTGNGNEVYARCVSA